MRLNFRQFTIAAALTVFTAPAWATPVTLNAVATPGGPVIAQSVDWKITKLDKTGLPTGNPVAAGQTNSLKTDLAPGRYVLVVTLGKTTVKQGLMIGTDSESRNIVIADKSALAAAAPVAQVAAGKAPDAKASATKPKSTPAQTAALSSAIGSSHLTIGMIPNSGRSAISEPISWQVYTYSKGATENGEMVASKTISNASFTLPAGSYVVRAAYKGTQTDLVIPLQAGQSYTYTINLYAGQAKLHAFMPGGRAGGAVNWQIVREKPDANGQYQLVTSSADLDPQLLIREGRYLVIGRMGDLWGVQPLSVTAGKVTSAKVKLQKSEGAPVVVAQAN